MKKKLTDFDAFSIGRLPEWAYVWMMHTYQYIDEFYTFVNEISRCRLHVDEDDETITILSLTYEGDFVDEVYEFITTLMEMANYINGNSQYVEDIVDKASILKYVCEPPISNYWVFLLDAGEDIQSIKVKCTEVNASRNNNGEITSIKLFFTE